MGSITAWSSDVSDWIFQSMHSVCFLTTSLMRGIPGVTTTILLVDRLGWLANWMSLFHFFLCFYWGIWLMSDCRDIIRTLILLPSKEEKNEDAQILAYWFVGNILVLEYLEKKTSLAAVCSYRTLTIHLFLAGTSHPGCSVREAQNKHRVCQLGLCAPGQLCGCCVQQDTSHRHRVSQSSVLWALDSW